jgi:hypothetical protein
MERDGLTFKMSFVTGIQMIFMDGWWGKVGIATPEKADWTSIILSIKCGGSRSQQSMDVLTSPR